MHERQKIPEEVLMRRVQFKAEPTDPCFAERSKRKKQNEAELTFSHWPMPAKELIESHSLTKPPPYLSLLPPSQRLLPKTQTLPCSDIIIYITYKFLLASLSLSLSLPLSRLFSLASFIIATNI